MPDYTKNYNLEKPAENEFYDVGVQNGNMDKLDTALAAVDAAKADAKGAIADADAFAVIDSADSSKVKRVLWSTIKSVLAQIFVPLTRKINNKALSADVVLTGEDIKTSVNNSSPIGTVVSELFDGYTDLTARVALLELILASDIASNPFTVTFSTLDGADITGVWNKQNARIEF